MSGNSLRRAYQYPRIFPREMVKTVAYETLIISSFNSFETLFTLGIQNML